MKNYKKVVSALSSALMLGSVSLAVVPSFTPKQPDGTNFITDILGIIQWIGIIVGVVMIIWVGVKYLMAGAGEKAKAKETLIPMLVGAGLVILAPTLMNTIYTFFTTAE